MLPVKLSTSIPQHAYDAEMVKSNEGIIAKQKGLSLYQLMELAGKSAFDLFVQQWPSSKTILIVCGSGNNAGDGFVFARLARQSGFHIYVHTLASKDEYRGDAAIACEHFIDSGGSFHKINEIDFKRVDVIVDAILGTGVVGDVRENYAYMINFINKLPQPILSLDLPSGLHADTGQIQGACIVATISVTFIAIKKGMLTGQAKAYCGDIYLAGLGIDKQFSDQITSSIYLNNEQYLTPLAKRSAVSHKGHSGRVLVVAGNKGMPGAARLSSEAALRCGAGLVSLVCHQDNQIIVASTRPELLLLDAKKLTAENDSNIVNVDIILIGPGLGTDEWAKQCYAAIIAADTPLVVDADALNLLAKKPSYRDNWVLTPHPGEAARLLGCSIKQIELDRFAAVRAIALKYGGVCVLKGAGTLISNGEDVVINLTGNAGMASGGMGDVLAGIIATLSLQSNNMFAASCYGVYLHGKAGDIAAKDGEKGLLASDLLPIIRQLVNQSIE
ncbi:NAD(P)H-hydrate dehydratase [Colwelliaceae bacterium BS250]